MVHFAVFFRYMEEAEHALWRAAGMSIHPPTVPASPKLEGTTHESEGGKWPRVFASFDFKRPLRFEDEFEVQVSIAAISARTIQYDHTIVRAGETIGTGTITVACVHGDADGTMKAVEIPAEILIRLRSALV